MDFMALKKVEHTFKEHTTLGERVIASDLFHVIVLSVCSFSWLFGTFLLEPLTLTNLLTNIDLCPHSAALGKSGMYTDTILAELLMRHWWCFRNPVNSPVEVGSLSHYLQGFKNPRCLPGFLSHQQYYFQLVVEPTQLECSFIQATMCACV